MFLLKLNFDLTSLLLDLFTFSYYNVTSLPLGFYTYSYYSFTSLLLGFCSLDLDETEIGLKPADPRALGPAHDVGR